MSQQVLIIADDAFDEPEVVPAAVEELRDVDRVHVVAPVIASRLDTLTEDDDAHRDAQDRSRRIVADLEDRGFTATGDYSVEDPLSTAVTELQAGDFDRVVVAVTEQGHWREEGLLEQLRGATDVPVTGVSVTG